MSDWQPIETAPKDGTEILLWAKDVGPRVGSFDSEFNNDPDGYRPYGGWWSLTGEISPAFPAWRDLEEVPAKNTPTHWMSLPEPPENE